MRCRVGKEKREKKLWVTIVINDEVRDHGSEMKRSEVK